MRGWGAARVPPCGPRPLRGLKAVTAADVKGRVGPGAVEGLLLTFECPVGA
ncbi:hypothetical protein AB0910_28155 [Streptomyces sp. NPDC047002]|uniref:hypothetical protein n=1 Tax=Streptomyces sp. NPDC047002 TaxID=3155475 RepID=UPI0034515B00